MTPLRADSIVKFPTFWNSPVLSGTMRIDATLFSAVLGEGSPGFIFIPCEDKFLLDLCPWRRSHV